MDLTRSDTGPSRTGRLLSRSCVLWSSSQPGSGRVLRVAEVPDPAPGPGELLVAVGAAGVNRADLLQRAGHYPPPPGAPPWPGLEVAGRVLAVGPDDGVRTPRRRRGGRGPRRGAAGRRRLRRAAPSSRRRWRCGCPDDLPDTEAAALPEALATVSCRTCAAAHAVAGETLLVRGGSGGVGSVAVPLARAARHAGAGDGGRTGPGRARRGPRRARRRSTTAADDLVARVLAATDGRGVDVVLDVLGAGALARQPRDARRRRSAGRHRAPARSSRRSSTSAAAGAAGDGGRNDAAVTAGRAEGRDHGRRARARVAAGGRRHDASGRARHVHLRRRRRRPTASSRAARVLGKVLLVP